MKKYLSLILAILMVLLFAGCAGKDQLSDDFNYSDSLDDNGFWKNVKALEHVELFDHERIPVPASVHTVSDEDLNREVSSLLAYYSTKNNVTDRSVADGDTLNIDFVGSVDGVEFAGGNTGGQGAEVTIGVTSYIDGFLEQLIGHIPGETFDIEVTFPEDYGHEDLDGKDAIFSITINYIIETVVPELTDTFVSSTVSDIYGWQTVAELEEGIRQDLRQEEITTFLEAYIVENSTIKTTPELLVTYQNRAIVFHYQDYADYYEMEFEEFINEYIGVSSVDELMEIHTEESAETVRFYLILQAIAEDAGITVTDEDVAKFFADSMNSDDYSEYEEFYGMPYLKLITLHHEITQYLEANVILE